MLVSCYFDGDDDDTDEQALFGMGMLHVLPLSLLQRLAVWFARMPL